MTELSDFAWGFIAGGFIWAQMFRLVEWIDRKAGARR